MIPVDTNPMPSATNERLSRSTPLGRVGRPENRHGGVLHCRRRLVFHDRIGSAGGRWLVGLVNKAWLTSVVSWATTVALRSGTGRRGAEALKRIMESSADRRGHGPARAHSAAMKKVGNADRKEVGGCLNNRAENSQLPADCPPAMGCYCSAQKGIVKRTSAPCGVGAIPQAPAMGFDN